MVNFFSIYVFVYVIFIFLGIVLFLLVGGMVWNGISRFIDETRAKRDRAAISKILIKEVSQPNEADISKLKPYESSVALLEELESFSKRFKGEEWDQIKQGICAAYLLPKARRFCRKRNWLKRNFSARVFAMAPFTFDLELILALIDDPVFLVRSEASKAILKLRDKRGVQKMIRHMGEEPGYAHYYFRDLLLDLESTEVMEWIEGWGVMESKRFTKIACLDLLSEKTYQMKTSLLQDSLNSHDPLIRLGAVKVHAHNPQVNSFEVLMSCLKDHDELIREEAAKGLKFYPSDKVFPALEESLNDPSWKVKIAAANTLKSQGPKGIALLKSLSEKNNLKAYQAAQYALNFG